MKKQVLKISRIIATFLLSVISLFCGQASLFAFPVFADSASVQEAFENINVLDDLKETTIDGKKFDLADYNFDETKELQIFSFVEFCYSFRRDNTDNYGLYVYIYNPQGLKIENDSSLHAITIRHGDDSSQNFVKYPLQFLNQSAGNYYGLFYKFKVSLSDKQKTEILQGDYKVNSTLRRYEVGEIELKMPSEIKSCPVGIVYKFSGYAKGYGADESAESTLKMITEGNQEVIPLKVKSTFYRPEGTNGKNDYTQDSLHSVYFAVPNHFINKYGEMYAVHASWLNAVLKPMLVTGNQSVYSSLQSFLGQDIGTFSFSAENNFRYGLYGNYEKNYIGDISAGTTSGPVYAQKATWVYNFWDSFWNGNNGEISKKLSTLYYAFSSGSETDSADDYAVPAETLYAELLKSKDLYGGELVNEKFSKEIFESVDDSITEVTLSRDDLVSGKSFLTSQKLTQSFWEKFWGKKNYTTANTDNISVIEEVTDEKLNGDRTTVCNRLYIFENDYNDFKNYYDTYAKSKNNEYNEQCTVYLFRYMVSDYISMEVTEGEYYYKAPSVGNLQTTYALKNTDTNAYFFQETVNLNFDIIDLTFVKDDVYTVIPVAMAPIDVIHDSTAPVNTTSDKNFDWKKLLQIVLGGLLLILLFIIFMPLLPTLISLIIKIAILPFRLLAAIFKAIFHKRE